MSEGRWCASRQASWVSSPAAQSWLLLICLPCSSTDAIVVCVCFACLRTSC
jgi:hypothetical protein